MHDRLARRPFIAALLALAGTNAQAAERPKVVATFSVLGDMVTRIAGDKVQLTTIVGGDADCELYQPTAADARAVADARLFVMNGLNPRFEPWAETLLKRAAFRGTKLVASQGANCHHRRPGLGAPSRARRPTSTPGTILPTVSSMWRTSQRDWPGSIRRTPLFIGRRRSGYAREIRALDAWAKSELAVIPSSKRRFITSHDGFEYLARAYDIEMTPARGMVNDTDPSAEDIARLIQQIRTTKVKAIFIENMNDPRLIERVAREAGATIGGTLYSDALSKPGGDADTYLKMVRHNVSTLKAAMVKN